MTPRYGRGPVRVELLRQPRTSRRGDGSAWRARAFCDCGCAWASTTPWLSTAWFAEGELGAALQVLREALLALPCVRSRVTVT